MKLAKTSSCFIGGDVSICLTVVHVALSSNLADAVPYKDSFSEVVAPPPRPGYPPLSPSPISDIGQVRLSSGRYPNFDYNNEQFPVAFGKQQPNSVLIRLRRSTVDKHCVGMRGYYRGSSYPSYFCHCIYILKATNFSSSPSIDSIDISKPCFSHRKQAYRKKQTREVDRLM